MAPKEKEKNIYKLHDLYNVLHLDGDLEDMDTLVGQVKLISSNWKGKCTIKKSDKRKKTSNDCIGDGDDHNRVHLAQ